jgi:hypothetical protein
LDIKETGHWDSQSGEPAAVIQNRAILAQIDVTQELFKILE